MSGAFSAEMPTALGLTASVLTYDDKNWWLTPPPHFLKYLEQCNFVAKFIQKSKVCLSKETRC